MKFDILNLLKWDLDTLIVAVSEIVQNGHEIKVYSRPTARANKKKSFDLIFLPGGSTRDWNFKAKIVVCTREPYEDALLRYRFMKYEFWPSQHGIPIAESYTLFIGTHKDIVPLQPDFITPISSDEIVGLTSVEEEFFYIVPGKRGDRMVFSSRYPVTRPKSYMHRTCLPTWYRGHSADPKDFKGLKCLPLEYWVRIFGLEKTRLRNIRESEAQTNRKYLYATIAQCFPVAMNKVLIEAIMNHLDVTRNFKNEDWKDPPAMFWQLVHKRKLKRLDYNTMSFVIPSPSEAVFLKFRLRRNYNIGELYFSAGQEIEIDYNTGILRVLDRDGNKLFTFYPSSSSDSSSVSDSEFESDASDNMSEDSSEAASEEIDSSSSSSSAGFSSSLLK